MIKPIHIDRLLIPRTRIHPIRILPEPRTRMHARNTRALLYHSSEVVVAAAEGPVRLHLVQPLHGGGLAGVGDVHAVACDVVLLVGEGGLEGDSVLHDEHCGFSEVSEAWILGAVALAATLDHVLFGKIVLYAAHLHQVRLVHGCHGECPARRTNSHVLHPGDGVLVSPIPIGRQVTAYSHLVRVIRLDVLAVDECYKNHEQNHQFYTQHDLDFLTINKIIFICSQFNSKKNIYPTLLKSDFQHTNHTTTSSSSCPSTSQTLTLAIWKVLPSFDQDGYHCPLPSQNSDEALCELSDQGLPATPSLKYPAVPPTARLIIRQNSVSKGAFLLWLYCQGLSRLVMLPRYQYDWFEWSTTRTRFVSLSTQVYRVLLSQNRPKVWKSSAKVLPVLRLYSLWVFCHWLVKKSGPQCIVDPIVSGPPPNSLGYPTLPLLSIISISPLAGHSPYSLCTGNSQIAGQSQSPLGNLALTSTLPYFNLMEFTVVTFPLIMGLMQ